ncbi:MAG: hypothetical protein ABFQ64_02965 [Campylobacterota bacterium]
MKTLIYTILFFLTLNTLYAHEVQHPESNNESSEYKLSLTTLDFAKTDKIVPGITLDLTDETYSYESFTLTLAHNLFKSADSLIDKVNPMKTAVYAQLNFRF